MKKGEPHTLENRTIILKSRPKGMVSEDNFRMIDLHVKDLSIGEVLIKMLYLSVDPYMRGRMNDTKSYITPFELGKPLKGRVIGEVVDTKSALFEKGDKITGMLDWADYSIANESEIEKIDETIKPITSILHVLGMTGMTAYVGLLKIGDPKFGETIVVSSAGGAVGMLVGQIGKIFGCKIIGITGSENKVEYLRRDLKFDYVINYKQTENLDELIQRLCPEGVDIYFDNVGGPISDSIYSQMNFHGRIVLCGQISQYNNAEIEFGPRHYSHFLTRSVKLQGFIVGDYKEHFSEARTNLLKWLNEDKIVQKEYFVHGLENAPKGLIGLFNGKNFGKTLIKN